jgi:hypothetical protein
MPLTRERELAGPADADNEQEDRQARRRGPRRPARAGQNPLAPGEGATKGEAKPEKAKADKHLRLKWKGNGSIYDAVSNGRGPIAGRYSVVTNRSAYRAVYVAAADQIEQIQDACSVKTAKAALPGAPRAPDRQRGAGVDIRPRARI